MAKTDFKTVEEYQITFSPEIRERLETIRAIIRKVAPDAEEIISYQIPAYKYLGYLIYYSGYKNHISLSAPFSEALFKQFDTELKDYTTSKSAIQFPNNEKLPVDLIKKIVQFRMKENEERQRAKSKK